MESHDAIIRSSAEDTIELIKEHRDELIGRLSGHDFLNHYLLQEFQVPYLSAIKVEFIKRLLLELKASPLDLSHYAALILETRKRGSLSISRNTEQYFRDDIERTIKNYL